MSAPKELRGHQRAAHDGLREGFRAGKRRGLLVIPTGGGKTVTALEMLRLSAEKGTRGLFLCDRRTLVYQAAREAREYGLACGVVMSDSGPDLYWPDAPVQFASKDTLLSRPDLLPDAGFVVVDEAHRSLSDYWAALLDRFPKAWLVGLTATPARADGRGLGRRYEFLVQPTSYSALQAAGVLTPAKCYSPGHTVQGTKARKPTRKRLTGEVVEWWQKLAQTDGRGRRTFLFASGVQHSLHLRDEFRAAGVSAEHLDGSTPDEEREAILGKGGALARGEVTVVCSCSVLKYGVDVPAVECVQIVDGFASLVDYLQACGRGLRAAPGKSECVVIDHSGAVLYHGFPDADRAWELSEDTDHGARHRKRMKSGEAPAPIACLGCGLLFGGRPECPECGWKPKRQGKAVPTAGGQLYRVQGETAAPAPAANRGEEYRRGWARCVAQCRHSGRTLKQAAAMFARQFGRGPWDLVSRADGKLPPAGYDWHRPAADWWAEAFERARPTPAAEVGGSEF